MNTKQVECPFCKNKNARASEELAKFRCFVCGEAMSYEEYDLRSTDPLYVDPEGSIYRQWLDAYKGEPDQDYQFGLIVTCLKEDIDKGLVAKDGAVHKALQDYYTIASG